jgi:hypothetical protein
LVVVIKVDLFAKLLDITTQSPEVHDRAAPRTGSLTLTCGKGWSMYFKFTKEITSRGHGPVSATEPKNMGRR